MGKQARLKQRRALAREGLVFLYAEAASEVLPGRFAATRCLNATRITVDVLEALGLPTKPMMVDAIASNEAWWQTALAKGRFPSGPDEAKLWELQYGAWAVGAVTEPLKEGEEGFPGHVVALCGSLLIDAAAGQLRRPERKILTPEVVVCSMQDNFLKGDPTVVRGDAGTVVSYKAHPENDLYRTAPGFQRSPWNREAAAEILLRVKQKLDSK